MACFIWLISLALLAAMVRKDFGRTCSLRLAVLLLSRYGYGGMNPTASPSTLTLSRGEGPIDLLLKTLTTKCVFEPFVRSAKGEAHEPPNYPPPLPIINLPPATLEGGKGDAKYWQWVV